VVEHEQKEKHKASRNPRRSADYGRGFTFLIPAIRQEKEVNKMDGNEMVIVVINGSLYSLPVNF